jgi:hypothetical protein
MELVRRLRLTSMLPRLRRDQEEHHRFGARGEEYGQVAGHDELIRTLEELEAQAEVREQAEKRAQEQAQDRAQDEDRDRAQDEDRHRRT